jgi:hypothetical protein
LRDNLEIVNVMPEVNNWKWDKCGRVWEDFRDVGRQAFPEKLFY